MLVTAKNVADGVPLFIEELTKTVLESSMVRETDGQYVLAGTLPQSSIPSTLNASLMARLDRLGTVREVAQIAATIGREFAHDLLAALMPGDQTKLQAALDQLLASGLIFRGSAAAHATYLFKHALVRDAAYDTLLRGRRQELHGRIVDVLEESFPDLAERRPELLADHASRAGMSARAVKYWLKAGCRSMSRSSMAEAVLQLRKGLDAAANLPEGRERTGQQLRLQSALCGAIVATHGQGAAESGESYRRARVLAEELGDRSALLPILSGLTTFHLGRAEYADAQQMAAKLLGVAEGTGDATSAMVGHRCMASCLHLEGRFAAALDHFNRALSLYRPEVHQQMAAVAAHDVRTAALSYLALVQLILGFPERARASAEESLRWAKQIGHSHILLFSLADTAYFHVLGCNEAAAVKPLEEMRALASEQKFPFWVALANLLRGHTLAVGGAPAEGREVSRAAFDELRRIGSPYNQSHGLAILASCHALAGKMDEALALIGRGLELADTLGERWFEAELHRLRGEGLLARDGTSALDALACFERALAVAREQEAKSWELRAAVSLAQLWRDQGRRDEAHDLLAPVYGWFTEGFDTRDLKQAKALLDELAGPHMGPRETPTGTS